MHVGVFAFCLWLVTGETDHFIWLSAVAGSVVLVLCCVTPNLLLFAFRFLGVPYKPSPVHVASVARCMSDPSTSLNVSTESGEGRAMPRLSAQQSCNRSCSLTPRKSFPAPKSASKVAGPRPSES